MSAIASTLGNRLAPPRFVLFCLVLAAAVPLASMWTTIGRAVMLGFDAAAIVFLASLIPLLNDDPAEMRAQAKANDANRVGLLALTGLVTIVILVAVANELSGKTPPLAAALVIATLALAWLFSNTIYALHYAHLFYLAGKEGDARGLDVPQADEPDYGDFVYFAFTLGMTFQTSDIAVTSRAMRRVVVGHCLAAFVFNLAVIAFTINVLGGG